GSHRHPATPQRWATNHARDRSGGRALKKFRDLRVQNANPRAREKQQRIEKTMKRHIWSNSSALIAHESTRPSETATRRIPRDAADLDRQRRRVDSQGPRGTGA